MPKLRCFVMALDEPFFLPSYVDGIISRCSSKVEFVGITPVPQVKKRSLKGTIRYAWKHIQFFGVRVFIRLAVKQVFYGVQARFYRDSLHSLKNVARKHEIPLITTRDINDPDYLDKLSRLNIDVILSSQPQIIRSDLLGLARWGCINRHTGFLPKYRGLFPVFWAMLNGEKEIGITVHRVDNNIDSGAILGQTSFTIDGWESMYDIYRRAYKLSIIVTAQVLEDIAENKEEPRLQVEKGRYFGFPDREAVKKFRAMGKTIL